MTADTQLDPQKRPTADDGRITFVGGLHRSGTSPLSRWLCSHPEISGLTDTGVPEDEGQHLQQVYPTAMHHGGPGRFAFDPSARLTEDAAACSPGAAETLIDAWAPYWDTSRERLLEKSPPNLVRLRFLRALFPNARFIVIVRHPAAVAMATQKWSGTSIRSLIAHWVAAHEHLEADAALVGRVALVRYEDLMAAPDQTMRALFAFLEVTPFDGTWSVQGALNAQYLRAYRRLAQTPRGLANIAVSQRHARAAARYGYDLRRVTNLGRPAPGLETLIPVSA